MPAQFVSFTLCLLAVSLEASPDEDMEEVEVEVDLFVDATEDAETETADEEAGHDDQAWCSGGVAEQEEPLDLSVRHSR